MNATISLGEERLYASAIKQALKKPTTFARPFGRKVWTWLRSQKAGVVDLGVLQRGNVLYEFEPASASTVKLTVREVQP